MNDEVYAAPFVAKRHTHKTSAFASPSVGAGEALLSTYGYDGAADLNFGGTAPEAVKARKAESAARRAGLRAIALR